MLCLLLSSFFFFSQDGWGWGDRGGEGGIKNVYEKEEHIHDLRLRPSYGLGLFVHVQHKLT